jgi:spore coat protein U-like protein
VIKSYSYAVALIATLFAAPAALAQTATGTLNVGLTVTSACELHVGSNDMSTTSAALNFPGLTNYGSHTSGDTGLTADVGDGAGGGNSILIACGPGGAATASVAISSNGTAGEARLLSSGGTNPVTIPYHLYNSAGTDNEWVAGTPQTITLTGTSTPVLVHGVINPSDITTNSATLTQGTYSDTLTVTLTL